MTFLLLTVRFLDDRYHGLLADDGPPEWPPSPFRLFCALVAGLARRGELESDTSKALTWLQSLEEPPIIITPKAKKGQAFMRYVPNNDGNKWPDRQDRLGSKPTIPTLFLQPQDQNPEVHYLWHIGVTSDVPFEHIRTTARSLTALGWGIDMAFADAKLVHEEEIQRLPGVRWRPRRGQEGEAGIVLRVPTADAKLQACTLSDLKHCHETAMQRILAGEPLHTLDEPCVFEHVFYANSERTIGRPIVFKLLDDNLDTTRYPHPLLAHIAAVVRHAAIDSMTDVRNAPSWISEAERGPWVSRFVRGKNEPSRDDHQQISYVPLPTIGHEHSDAMIRNVMLIAPMGRERELEHVAARLDGVLLKFKDTGEDCDAGTPPRVPLPHSIQRFNPPKGKFIDKCYLGRSKVWQSVTPVILDEHIDKKTRETKDGQKIKYRDPDDFRRLIILALHRAGIETACTFIWQTLPFYRNCLTAHRYDRNKRPNYLLPKRLDGKTAVHVRIEFEHPIAGPITLGAGRHCGFGLMAGLG